MEQHAVPQQISSYQFRLVGDMTLKQFFQLAGGCLVSLLFYASPLHPLIKWPFIIFFALLGVALAFLPFEERPLEKWIIAFFRSVYSPTLFFWQKAQAAYLFFQEEAATELAPEKRIAYGSPPFQTAAVFSKLEEAEKSFLSSIAQLLIGGIATVIPSTAKPTEPLRPAKKEGVQIPQNAPTSITQTGLGPNVIVGERPMAKAPAPELKLSRVGPTISEAQISGQQAQFAVEAAPPNPPTIPNIIVGQIFDTQGKIINGAILEMRDAAGRPVRALKSNMLGHFIIVTPLQNGTYEIIIEKEGFNFDRITFEANGEIIPPIAIKAKGAQKILTTEEIVNSRQLMASS